MAVTKSVLILNTDPRLMIQAQQFLSNRDWQVFITTQLKEALQYLITQKPSFFLVSVEHPQTHVENLMRMVMQTYPTVVIPFAENSNMNSFKLLTQINARYRIFPPVTGPSVERAVNRFLKDLSYKQAQELAIQRAQSRAKNGGLGIAPVLADKPEILEESVPSSLLLGLNESFQESSGDKVSPIGLVTRSYCLMVDSPQYCGYLVVAAADNRTMDQNFISTIKHRLLKSLSRFGEPVRDGESFQIDLKPVNFESWALAHAEFLKKTIHLGQEIAMAFFPIEKVRPLIRKTEFPQMRSVQLSDLEEDQVVPMNLYIHLPMNDRFIIYTGQGGIFYSEQKQRLLAKGLGELFIQEIDVPRFVQYCVQNRLNHLIEGVETAASPRASVA